MSIFEEETPSAKGKECPFLSWLWLPPAAGPYPVSILSYHVIQWANFLLTWPSSITKFIMWLKMKWIWRSDWRLEWERWVHFARLGFPALVLQEKFLFLSNFFHPLLTKLVRSRWPDFGHLFLRLFKQTWSTEHVSERTRCLSLALTSSARFRVACVNVKCISYNCSFYFDWKQENPQLCNLQTRSRRKSGAPKENVVQNHLNIALLNVF